MAARSRTAAGVPVDCGGRAARFSEIESWRKMLSHRFYHTAIARIALSEYSILNHQAKAVCLGTGRHCIPTLPSGRSAHPS
jgi:hypothetical protein